MPGMVVEAAPTGGGVDVARRSIRRLAWAPLVWFERRSTASSTAGAGLMPIYCANLVPSAEKADGGASEA